MSRLLQINPVVVEAFRLGHDDPPKWYADAVAAGDVDFGKGGGVYLRTRRGVASVQFGDWIAKDVAGGLFAMSHQQRCVYYREVTLGADGQYVLTEVGNEKTAD